MRRAIHSALILIPVGLVVVGGPLCPRSQAQQVFSENPITASPDPHDFNTFMQLDAISLQNLHTGVDVTASVGNPVFPPIPAGTTCQVWAVGSNYVALYGSARQDGDYALCQLLHIIPNPLLEVNSWISPTMQVGTIDGEAHLHFEVLLSPDGAITNADLHSPRRYALGNVTWNTADNTPPAITQDPVIHEAPVGQPNVWQVWAGDLESGVYNGIGGMELQIDNTTVDGFDFRIMANKAGHYPPSASEYYYSLTPPQGNNNPNTIQYKLSWTATDDNEHVWRLLWWDARLNSASGDPTQPPAVPLLVDGVGGNLWVEDGVIRTALRWRVRSPRDIESFDVFRSLERDGEYRLANLKPIIVGDGARDLEFLDTLPEGWSTVWYRLTGRDRQGNSYEFGETLVEPHHPRVTTVSSYPNPSRAASRVEIDIAEAGAGQIAVYNARGQLVKLLHEGELPYGRAVWTWDGRNGAGDLVSAGIYFVRILAADELVLHKLAVIR